MTLSNKQRQDIKILLSKKMDNKPENSGKLFLAVFRPHIQGLYETHPYIRGV